MNKLIIPLLLLLSLPLVFQSVPTEILKLKTFDALVKEYEPSGNFVVLNITEEDIEREGGYPLPRQRLAEIQLELLGKGALGVGWVISFPQADRMGGDEEFLRSLGYAPSVLAMFETPNNKYPSLKPPKVSINWSSVSFSGLFLNNPIIPSTAKGKKPAKVSFVVGSGVRLGAGRLAVGNLIWLGDNLTSIIPPPCLGPPKVGKGSIAIRSSFQSYR